MFLFRKKPTPYEFPQRTTPSLSDNAQRIKQENASPVFAGVSVLTSWSNVLAKRPFDVAFFGAWKGTAAIAVSMSERSIPGSNVIEAVFERNLPFAVHAEAFLKGSMPVLRMHFGFPTADGGHFFFESPLDLRQGDVQEFCGAILADEHVDVVLRHDDMSDPGTCFMKGFKAKGFTAILRAELQKTVDGFRREIASGAFNESVKLLEQTYSFASQGISPSRKALLVPDGAVRNACSCGYVIREMSRIEGKGPPEGGSLEGRQSCGMVRVFISSTFSDFVGERNALQRTVFPALRRLCETRGFRFQAIDLRWGINSEAALDQRTMRICLAELRECMRLSPRPNMLILLGDRYGWRPLPEEIPSDEFDMLLNAVPCGIRQVLVGSEGADGDGGWYRLDENALRPCGGSAGRGVYVLQPRKGKYEDYSLYEREVERPLRDALLAAAERVGMSDDMRFKYEAAATHQEIRVGAMESPVPREHVFACFRESLDLEEDHGVVDDPRAGLMDLMPGGGIDLDARQRLRALKEELTLRLGPDNVFAFQESLRNLQATSDRRDYGVTAAVLDERLLDEGRPAPATFCSAVYRGLGLMILKEMEALRKSAAADAEGVAHREFGRNRADSFVSPSKILAEVAAYLRDGRRHTLLLVGEDGVGKTAVLARAAAERRAESPIVRVVDRYAGLTPASASIDSLILDLCSSLAECRGSGPPVLPDEPWKIRLLFAEALAVAGEAGKIALFIDEPDALAPNEDPQVLEWLSGILPEGVKIVCTLRAPMNDACHELVRSAPGDCVLHLGAEMAPEGARLLDAWLCRAGRTLQESQRRVILAGYEHCRSPLWLRYAFETARLWPSWNSRAPWAPTAIQASRNSCSALSGRTATAKPSCPRSSGISLRRARALARTNLSTSYPPTPSSWATTSEASTTTYPTIAFRRASGRDSAAISSPMSRQDSWTGASSSLSHRAISRSAPATGTERRLIAVTWRCTSAGSGVQGATSPGASRRGTHLGSSPGS